MRQWSRARGGFAVRTLLLGLIAMATAVAAPVFAAESDDAVAPQVPAIVTVFGGLNEVSAGFGYQASAQIGKAIARVLHAANTAIQLRTTAGGLLAQVPLTAFFGTSDAFGDFDFPKVYCDANAPALLRRCYVLAVQTKVSARRSTIWLAVSRTVDPLNLGPAWCRYRIDGTRNPGTVNASFPEFFGFGLGADKLVITTNQVRYTNKNFFTFATIRAMSKFALANNAQACPPLPPVAFFQPTPALNSPTIFAIQPVLHLTPAPSLGGANPAYLVNTVGSSFGPSQRYLIWRVVNLAPIGLQGPFLVNGNFVYEAPDSSPQPGTLIKLDAGDARVSGAAGFSRFIEVVHATKCFATRSCIRWIRFAPSAGGAAISGQTVFGGASPGEFVYKPGVAVNRLGTSAVVYHASSATQFLQSEARIKSFGFPAFLPPELPVTPPGTCAYTPAANSFKTGEYPGVQTDPVDLTSFWASSERATRIAGLPTCGWATRNVKMVGP